MVALERIQVKVAVEFFFASERIRIIQVLFQSDKSQNSNATSSKRRRRVE